MDPIKEVYRSIDESREEMIDALIKMCRIPALSPNFGGEGEYKKARFIEKLIEDIGVTNIEWHNAPDNVPIGYRPNIVTRLKGKKRGRGKIWVVTHMDVVPPGDRKKWIVEPFNPMVKNEKIYGRGVEDNGQDLIASIYALKALKREGLVPKRDVCLAFLADEECGSEKGIKYVIKKGVFESRDLIIVPDFGSPDGSKIQVAEKNLLWIKITTKGKQCHASMPHRGINAFRVASTLVCKIDKKLHNDFGTQDQLFEPPYSTFEATKKEGNVPNINTIPGEDIFYMDFRILPRYPINKVLETVKEIAKSVDRDSGVKIEIEVVQQSTSPPTPEKCEVVRLLKRAIKNVLCIEPRVIGIGGGTYAAVFRRAGFDTAVWSTVDKTAHEVNEYIKIENMVNDAKVYATLFLS